VTTSGDESRARRAREVRLLLARLEASAVRVLPPGQAEALVRWAQARAAQDLALPGRGRGLAWSVIAAEAGLDGPPRRGARRRLWPALAGLRQALAAAAPTSVARPPRARRPKTPPTARPSCVGRPAGSLAEALDREMRRWNDNAVRLAAASTEAGAPVLARQVAKWRQGAARPKGERSLAALSAIEGRYGLAPGELAGCVAVRARAPGLSALRPHLPEDFASRSAADQAEILDWIGRTFRNATAYRRYQTRASRDTYRIGFSGWSGAPIAAPTRTGGRRRPGSRREAAEPLASEMAAFLAFKTVDLAPAGFLRRGAWNAATAQQGAHRLGLLFGALAAPAGGPVAGLGVPPADLSLALLCLPQVWDWHLAWRRRRRGFFTAWEAQMLDLAAAITHPETGWLSQNPSLAGALRPIEGLVSEADVARVSADWPGACRAMHQFARMRARELGRIARTHRDPFEAVLPVLEAASPLAEYLKIAEEVRRRAPCEQRRPLRAAESRRDFLMIRLALHTGLRARNLQELLVSPPGRRPHGEAELARLRRAELRWDAVAERWEVFAPAAAFKNARSSFFAGRAFRLPLPDRGGLYTEIAAWLSRSRPLLLAGAPDPGVFFVRRVRAPGDAPALDRFRFHQAWRRIIERHGIFNPYTGRGAVPGLLPHGPHAVRAVLATHVLKVTGSCDQAAYAIQDTAGSIQRHYARFLPTDKAAIAAEVLDRVWAQ
jgi:hypothetical protein